MILLEELGLPFETEFVDFSKIKDKPYTDVNPNGRVPAIVDPNNNNFVLWESGAIITYLVDTYDKEHKLTYTSSPEKWQILQWVMFQMSGQGPYFGQAAWFIMFHSEQLPSAQERYLKEIERVIGVIDAHLASKPSGQQLSLVGDKVTYADLAFVTWAAVSELTPLDGVLLLPQDPSETVLIWDHSWVNTSSKKSMRRSWAIGHIIRSGWMD